MSYCWLYLIKFSESMRLRLAKVDEVQFLTCLKYQVWGSNSFRFKDWRGGDAFIVIVDKALAGFAEVAGEPYISDTRIWEKGLYPCRIPLYFNFALLPQNRPLVTDEVRIALISSWGTNYGLGILAHALVTPESAEIISNTLLSRENQLNEMQTNIDEYLNEAKQNRRSIQGIRRRKLFNSRLSR